MKRETVNYFTVGLFVLAALAALLGSLYFIVGGNGERDIYYTRYRNVAGLAPGTLVTYEGFRIGRVAAIEPQRNNGKMEYQVELHVSRGWQIPVDSVARIYSDGLLSETVVNISEGNAGTFLAVGGQILGEQGVDLFATMGKLAGEFGSLSDSSIKPLLDNLGHSVQKVGGELEVRVPALLDDVQQLVNRLDSSASYLNEIVNEDTASQARRAIGNIDRGAAGLSALIEGLGDVRRDAQQLIGRLDQIAVQAQPDLQQAIGDLRYILMQVSRYSDGILQNLDSGSRNMSEFSRQIRENPTRLISGSTSAEIEKP